MIAQPEYVKQLIRKRFENTLSEQEKGRLKAARLIYTEEEWWEMISDVLITMENENATPPFTDGWRPPIFDKLERRERRQALLKKWRVPIAASIIVLLASVAWLTNSLLQSKAKPDVVGDCVNMDDTMVVPTSWHGGTIMLPDSSVITSNTLRSDQSLNLPYVRLSQPDPWTLKIIPVPGQVYTDSIHKAFIEVHTMAKQQYTVILPNKTSILLNAGTTLKISFRQLDSMCYVYLKGQALVKMPEEGASNQRLILETPNAQIQSADGEFAILGICRYSQMTLLSGRLVTFTRKGAKQQVMDSPGDQVIITKENKLVGKSESVIESNCRKSNMRTAIAWTKAVRYYQDISLRQFVAEMCQWYGLSIQNINCVPASVTINTAYCYQTAPQILYAQIRAKGIAVEEDHGVLTFCDPSPAKKSPWAGFSSRIPSIAAIRRHDPTP